MAVQIVPQVQCDPPSRRQAAGATVLQFPTRVQREKRRRMNLVELDARHSWMMENRGNWDNVATDGVKYHEPMVALLMAKMREMDPVSYPPMTAQRMRRDIAEGRKLIEKRNRAKAWLASLGADLQRITTPEQALFFAFDKLA